MSEQYANLASCPAVSALDNSSTSAVFSLSAGGGAQFPATTNGNFRVTVSNADGTNAEVMLCIGRSTDVLTVNRGSSALLEAPVPTIGSHSVGSLVSHNITTGAMNQIRIDESRTTFSGALPTDGRQGDRLFPTDDVVVSLHNGTGFVPGGTGYPLRGSPTAQTWSWYNQGSASVSARGQSIAVIGNPNSSVFVQGRTFPIPANSGYCALITVQPYLPYGSFPFVGAGFTDGSAKVALAYVLNAIGANNEAATYTGGGYYQTPTSTSSVGFTTTPVAVGAGVPVTFALQDDGTHRKYGISFDGGLYIRQLYSENTNTNVTPTALGVFTNPNDFSAIPAAVITNVYLTNSTLF